MNNKIIGIGLVLLSLILFKLQIKINPVWIIGLVGIFIFFNANSFEHFEVDIGAIKTYNEFVANMSKNGFTIPGNLTINGNLTLDGYTTITGKNTGQKMLTIGDWRLTQPADSKDIHFVNASDGNFSDNWVRFGRGIAIKQFNINENGKLQMEKGSSLQLDPIVGQAGIKTSGVLQADNLELYFDKGKITGNVDFVNDINVRQRITTQKLLLKNRGSGGQFCTEETGMCIDRIGGGSSGSLRQE